MKNIYNYFFVILLFLSMSFISSTGSFGLFNFLVCIFSASFLVLNNKEDLEL